MRTKEAATQEVFFPSSYLAKSVYSFGASLPCLDDISSFSELNDSVKWNKGDSHIQTHKYTIYTLILTLRSMLNPGLNNESKVSISFLISSYSLAICRLHYCHLLFSSSLSLVPVFSSLYFSSVRSGETFLAESQCRRMRLIKFSDQVTHIEFEKGSMYMQYKRFNKLGDLIGKLYYIFTIVYKIVIAVFVEIL